MKKRIIVVMLSFLIIGLSSCTSTSRDSTYKEVVDSDKVTFTLEVDYLELQSFEDMVHLNVKMKAKERLYVSLPSGSFDETHLIEIKVINPTTEEKLFTNYDSITGNCELGGAGLKRFESVTKQYELTAISMIEDLIDHEPIQNGEYQVYVRLYGENDWIKTDLVIVVNIQ